MFQVPVRYYSLIPNQLNKWTPLSGLIWLCPYSVHVYKDQGANVWLETCPP